MLLSWMLSVAYSWWISPPRYIMAMFPMFILMGLITKNKIVNIAITGFSTAWLCYNAPAVAFGTLNRRVAGK